MANAHAGSQRRKVPISILDLASATSFAAWPHAVGVEEVLHDLYVRRVSPKVWTPRDEAERAVYFNAVRYWGGVEIIVDEIVTIADANRIEPALVSAVMMWGHGKLGPTAWHITAQRPAYINRKLWPAFDRAFVFCLAPGADAKRVEQELGIPVHESQNLARGEAREVELGFPPDSAKSPAPDASIGDVQGSGGAPPGGRGEDEGKRDPQP